MLQEANLCCLCVGLPAALCTATLSAAMSMGTMPQTQCQMHNVCREAIQTA